MTSIAEGVFGDGDAADAVDDTAHPYGLIGLVVSLVLILLAAVVLCIVVSVAAAVGFGLVRGLEPLREALSTFQTKIASDADALERFGVVVSLVFYAALIAAVLAAARIRGGRGWRGIVAWRPWHPFRGARLFWILVPVMIVYNVASGALISTYVPASKDWIKLPTGAPWVGAFILLAVVFAPITEELLFRGWMYTSLRRTIGVWAAIIVTSLLFAAAHWEGTHLYALAVLPVGLVLGLIRERTGSIKATMLFHALFNGAASALIAVGM